MWIQLKIWPHPSEKDHTIMTGWTLKIDKVAIGTEPLHIYTYTVNLFPNADESDDFFKSVHSTEHMLAYSRESGSVRSSMEEVVPWFDGKSIIDISPYKFDTWNYGFRITSTQRIDTDDIKKALKQSIANAIEFTKTDGILGCHDGVPFASEKECWQYDFHTKSWAQKLLLGIAESFEVTEKILTTPHYEMTIWDLRLLKPKRIWQENPVMLTPRLSFRISNTVEKKLPVVSPGTLTIAGTFWCMTGMYLWVSSESINDESLMKIHSEIMEIIKNMERWDLQENEKIQIQTVLENYEKFWFKKVNEEKDYS